MNKVMIHKQEVALNGVNFSESAARQVITYLKKNNHKGIRLAVKQTGCSGLSYVLTYVDTPKEQDIVLDTSESFLICVDKASYPYLKGLKVDYIKHGLGYKFAYFNPNQTGECGCGESFTVSGE